LLTFLQQLFETGEIIVTRQPPADDQLDDVQSLLLQCESVVRQDWPGEAPKFDVDVATQAARVLMIFCQATVYRELDEHEIQRRLDSVGLTAKASASCHYSADLVLQFLADVHHLLARSATEDPVLQLLASFAKQWPFSAVGIPDAAVASLPEFFTTDGMFRAYVDRVIARSDTACCKFPMVTAAVKASIGDYPALAPEFVAAFESAPCEKS